LARSGVLAGTFEKIPELWFPVPLEVCMKTYYWLDRNRFLSHLRTSFCALVIVGASLTLSSAQASGSAPGTITGGFAPCFNFAAPPRPVGEDTIIMWNITVDVTGDFTGTLVGTEMDVIHPDGSITLHGSALFTGSYNGGASGTLVYTFNGIGNAITGHETLNFVARQGTDGLAGIYAQGTAVGDLGAPSPGCYLSGAGTYTGQIVFAP
jgi:hypothetical protein